MEDSRFKHITTDPKFRRIPKSSQKVKIDKRFKSMFKSKKFKVKYTVDKRGRPVNHNSTEDLKRYYKLGSDDESSSDDSENEIAKSQSKTSDEYGESKQNNEEPGKYVESLKNNKLTTKPEETEVVSGNVKEKLKNLNIDYARGEAPLISESSSDDEEEEEPGVSDTEQIEHKWGELDADAEQTENITCRLAACNMDWDRIRAVDLMVLFNSFLPPGGAIKSVTIYPSEFGKERMKEEDMKGPVELVDKKVDKNEDENEEGSQYHMEKLRQYQLNRLKYYYAVIEFDSLESANKVYTECDGMEYESSAIKIDLRFIPDDMMFENDPKDFCEILPEVNKYQPRFFTTTALQQVKVDLTWDETNPERIELAEKLNKGKVDNITDADLQNYLASSSGEDPSDNEENGFNSDTDSKADIIDKYKLLLQGIEEKEKSKTEKDVELEISWGIDLKEKTEKLVKQKLHNNENATPFQKYVEKRKERQKEKKKQKKKIAEDKESDSDIPSDIDMNDSYFAEEFKKPEFRKEKGTFKNCSDNEDTQKQAELELLLMNEDGNKNHFNLKKIQDIEDSKQKKKRKSKEQQEDNFKIDLKDERFSALFTSHHYNIDPTDPHYKKTKAMEVLTTEKLKRRTDNLKEDNNLLKRVKDDLKKSELNMLVKSVKRKTKEFKSKA